jgi:NitT/TauT family transport system substrate-binding protein
MAKITKNMIMLILLVIIILASIFLYSFLQQKTIKPHDKLTIGIATWPGFASGMVGREKGLFDGIELEFKIMDDAPARHAAFQSGAIDIMISSVDVFAQEAAQGIKGRIIIVTDESFGGDGIVAKLNIKTPEELNGKKIAFARATPSHFLLYKVLEKYGLTPSNIKQVTVDDPGNAAQAFLGGSVDAAVTWEPFLTEVKEKGKGHVLLTTHDYPGIIVDVLIASDKLSQNSDLLRRFIKGWLGSIDYIKEHPDECAKIISEGLNIKGEDVKGMMAGLRFADKKRNAELFNSRDFTKTRIADILREAAAFWKSQGIISEIPPMDHLISPTANEYLNYSEK